MKKLMLVFYSLSIFLSACGGQPQAHSILIAAGGNHTCALSGDGAVKCWGSNEHGQLGNGTLTGSALPVTVSGLADEIIAVAAGGRHSCALNARGEVRCWGDNSQGQLGNGTLVGSPIPVPVGQLPDSVLAIAAGDRFTCALTAVGGVLCWGSNEQGQLGNGGSRASMVPIRVTGLESGISAIAAGGSSACALNDAGGVKCWGANQFGQLGDKSKKDRLTPVEVSGLRSGVAAIAVGGGQSCALMSNGSVRCWGWDGNESQSHDITRPADVAGLDGGVSAIAAGAQHTCAVQADHVKCWGSNYVGQLGDPALAASSTPVQVNGLGDGILAISTGAYHTCVLGGNARVACWGQNYQGELGDGQRPYSATPVSVPGLRTATFASLTATAAPTNTPAPTATQMPPTLVPWPTPTGLAILQPGHPVTIVWLHMLDAAKGWGIDATGHILRTTDGGFSWTCVTPPSGAYDARSFYPVDSLTAWAAALPVLPGSEGCTRQANCHLAATLWHTVDGGATWQANKAWQASKPLARPVSAGLVDGPSTATGHGLFLLDPATGWFLLEDRGTGTDILTVLARTSDGGQSLAEIWRTTGIARYTGVAFINKQVGYLGLDDTTFFDRLSGLPLVSDYLDGKQAPYLETTADGGRSWDSVFLPRLAPIPAELQSLASTGRHMLCGVDRLALVAPQALDARVICRVAGATVPYRFEYLSSDGGGSWHSWLSSGNESFLDPAVGWRFVPSDAGRSGQFQQTANGGLNWVTLGSAAWQNAGFDFIDQQTGWAVVDNAGVVTLMRTADGGHHWVTIPAAVVARY